MIKYLISTTEVYRVNSEKDAETLIAQAKSETSYELIKYYCEKKEKRVKGEIEDTWFKVTLIKGFNSEKEPISLITVNYEVE